MLDLRNNYGLLKRSIATSLIIILCVSGLALYLTRSQVRGNLKPVVTDVQLVTAYKVVDGYVTVWKFKKVRECEFVGLAFYQGNRDEQFLRLAWEPMEPDPNSDQSRPEGVQVTDPILIKTDVAPYETVQGQRTTKNWFADVRHDCDGKSVRTQFWN